MSWRDRLRPASWRNVAFFVEDSELTGGRRVQVHEFIQRDKPYVEDLGRKNRTFRIRAWICAHESNDYDPWPARDALIAALETGGRGKLIHPYFGEIQGHSTDFSIAESGTEKGGFVGFDIVFVESGELDFRVVSIIDTKTRAANAIDAAYTAAASDFARTYSVDNAPDFVLKDMAEAVNQLSKSLVLNRALYPAQLQIAFKVLEQVGGTIVTGGLELARAVIDLVREVGSTRSLHEFSRPNIPSPRTVGRALQRANSEAFVNLVRASGAAREAELGIDLVANSERYASEDSTLRGITQLITREEMQTARRRVSDVVSDYLYQLSDAGSFSETQSSLIEMRTEAVQHMTAEGEHLARVFQTNCCDGSGWQKSMPAVMLAYRHYGTLTDEVIALRNRLPSPLFIEPHKQIELVTL